MLADKDRIEGVVGAGGFGVVYRGEHIGFGEPIAVKCLRLGSQLGAEDREKLLARLKDEGRVLHRLSKLTSGIVQALDVGAVTTKSGAWVPYLVLEWLEGQTLAQLVQGRRRGGEGAFSVSEALALLSPAAEALGIAHKQRVAHRDVKPENLFVTDIGGRRTMKVLDFGIAKVLTHTSFTQAPAATEKQATAFTPSYGAPEQFNKKRGATGPWTDVFALALIFVELVTGARALEGEDATQLYIASADPAARPTPRHHGVDVGDAIDEVLVRALAIDPADRFQDASTFFEALRRAAEASGDVTATPSGHAPGAPPVDSSDTGEFVVRHAYELDAPLDAGAHRVMQTLPVDGSASSASPHTVAVADEDGGQAAASGSRGAGENRENARNAAGTTSPPESAARGSGFWLPFVAMVSLAGAGALYWQLRSITDGPVASDGTVRGTQRRAPKVLPRATVPSSAESPTPAVSAVAASSASATASASSAGGGPPDGGAAASASASSTASAAPPFVPPPDMVAFAMSDGRRFLLERTEVTTRSYLECVTAGRCKKASRAVLTDEAASALGVPDLSEAAAPDRLAAAWEKRCNQTRGAADHPVNCVSFGSAEDYCGWRGRRLPTAAEWKLAAAGNAGRRHPWGDLAPECQTACYGKNGGCVGGASEVASCTTGSHANDATPEGLMDLGGNVAEWVTDVGPRPSSDGPPWRMLMGGSFLDEADKLAVSSSRAAPPVTAFVSIGLRCAMDVPAAPAN